jgi:glycosyltransferase involved in cell wall biosynthesis
MQSSVVIPTHNPRLDYLNRVLEGLRRQTLPLQEWEVIIVDNASDSPVADRIDLCWHPHSRVVREEKLGLTAARLTGFSAASGEIIVLVDDDNLLAPDYLAVAVETAATHSFLGSWSGAVELVFEPGSAVPPPSWRSYLTERVCEQAVWSNDPSHNASTPWGAGMCVRQSLAAAYLRSSEANPGRFKLDLQGCELVYGGDTDIAYQGCAMGLGKGVFPGLKVSHLIPPSRCERDYLLRVIEGHAYSELLHQWVLHGALPADSHGWMDALKRASRRLLWTADQRAIERARQKGRQRARRELEGRR